MKLWSFLKDGFPQLKLKMTHFVSSTRLIRQSKREHSNKWDPSERLFKEPLLWGIRRRKVCVVGGSNFETHKNVSDNFYFVYMCIYTGSKYPKSSKKFEGLLITVRPSNPSVPSNSAFGLACRCSH